MNDSDSDRLAFALPPGTGQESVWDYPRPLRRVAAAADRIMPANNLLVIAD